MLARTLFIWNFFAADLARASGIGVHFLLAVQDEQPTPWKTPPACKDATMETTLNVGAGVASQLKLARFSDELCGEVDAQDTLGDEQPEIRLFSSSAECVPSKSICDERSGFELRNSIALARDFLLSQQRSNGSWSSAGTRSAAMSARLLLLLKYLGADDGQRAECLADEMLGCQLSEGGWAADSSGAFDLSTSVLCYAAIKLRGGPRMLRSLAKSRRAIGERGGATRANNEVKSWLALLGQCELVPDQQAWLPQIEGTAIQDVNPLYGVGELFIGTVASDCDAELPFTRLTTEAELVWKRLALELFAADIASKEIAKVEAEIEQLIDGEEACLSVDNELFETAASVSGLLESATPAESTALSLGVEQLLETIEDETFESLSTQSQTAALSALARYRMENENLASLPPMLRCEDFQTIHQRMVPSEGRIENACQSIVSRLEARCSQLEQSSTQELASVLEAVAKWGGTSPLSGCDAIPSELMSRQSPSGAWVGNDGEVCIVVTSQVLSALCVACVDADSETVLAGVNWLLAEQGLGGSWSQQIGMTTAAVAALAATGFATDESCEAAVGWLMDCQLDSGGWSPGDCECDMGVSAAVLSALSQAAVNDTINPSREEPVCLRLAMTGTIAS